MPLRFALFDLDNTLYPAASGLWEAIGERIDLYMIDRLGLDPTTVPERRRGYLATFGTTLKGLRHEYQVDADAFLAFVHDLPLERYLQPDAELDAMLARLDLPKVVFTNADAPHARRVLDRLGVAAHFSRIIDIHALEFLNKPDPRAYGKALELLAARAEECIFVEDSVHNLRTAHELGMKTVLVGESQGVDGFDYHVATLRELGGVLDRLITADGEVAPELGRRNGAKLERSASHGMSEPQ